jgi:anti-anti-sigma factor
MFEVRQIGGVTVAVAPGQLDARNAAAAKNFLKALVEGQKSRLVVDLSALNFVDSAGLGVLLTALKTARNTGGDVKLCGINAPVKTIFELTRLFRVFDSFPTAEQAAASF